MPQMSPYNWLILLFIFNMIIMFFSSYNHFLLIYQLKNKNKNSINYYTWKW
uniref:ATP synthase F0 subunit 8 n=1 Tax=Amblyjoppa sp. ZJUH_2016002 TaxID=2491150 RepID=A0A3S5HLN1_9HYME|nr:ATP synthase F0 subunit 8 [Amblyjoppa sp. ZJUH_2016002]